jgi:cellulose biosynthesis protein BcsQ
VHQAGMGGQFYGVLPTFYDRVTKETMEQLKALAKDFGDKVLPPIPVDTKFREAPLYGQTIWEYAPDSRGARGILGRRGDERLGGYSALVERTEKELLYG